MTKEKPTNWHKHFQDVLEDRENLEELSGKIISEKAREYQQQIRIDFYAYANEKLPEKEAIKIVRPFDHFRKKNVIEYKSTMEVLNEEAFRRYVGRALDAETTENANYQGETTLTMLTVHKPFKLLSKAAEYKIKQLNEWKYQSSWILDLDIHIILLGEIRNIKGGEALALLQVLESDLSKQTEVFKTVFGQNLRNKDRLKDIVLKINKEAYMSIIEEAKAESKAEIAIKMLKDGLNTETITKYTELSQEEILKLKENLSK